MRRHRSPALHLAVVVATLAVGAGQLEARPDAVDGSGAVAGRRAVRDPHDLVEYDVFGDSIVAGFGVPGHLSWVAGVSYHLSVTEDPDVEHRFHNHAIGGQSIVTPSFLADDADRSTLLAHLAAFLGAPPRDTPLAERIFVLTPSVNELIVSDQGSSSQARIAKAVAGMRAAVDLLRSRGVPPANIVVLPMPSIGLQFAADYDNQVTVDDTLADMIVRLNAALGPLLDLGRYPSFDPNLDGLADFALFDGLSDPATGQGRDGLHPDAQGHARLSDDVQHLFGTG